MLDAFEAQEDCRGSTFAVESKALQSSREAICAFQLAKANHFKQYLRLCFGSCVGGIGCRAIRTLMMAGSFPDLYERAVDAAVRRLGTRGRCKFE